MKRVLRTFAVLATVAVVSTAAPAWAQVTGTNVEQWTFQNVTFSSGNGGGSLTGYFTVNAVTHSLLTWSVTTSAGSANYFNGTTGATMPVPGFTYNNSTSWSSTSNVILTDPVGQPLWFIAGMPGTQGFPQLGVTLTATTNPDVVSVATNSGENWDASGGHVASRGFATGYLQRSLVSPVPEPSGLVLTLAGLAIVGSSLRRSRAAAKAPLATGLQPA
ncbi:MAG TPA: PEP-CTERM sorting domain-containing protein [Usitatibacter sp.]|jgi:hypothetical protein|nr:PEP-CTERM sorting domain-containing protein [Usitatibacter sp.]